MESKKAEVKDMENRPVNAGTGGKMGKGGQRVQTSIYKINKSWGCNVQHGDYS